MAGRTRIGRRALAALAAVAATAGAVAVTAPSAQAVDTQRVRVVTANVNFGASASAVMDRFANYSQKADVVLLQETKNVDFHYRLRNDSTWVVRQKIGAGDAKQNVAVLVRRSIVASGSDVGDITLVKGTDPRGCDILTRYIGSVRVKLKNGGVIRPASVHLPPKRCQTGPDGPYEAMIRSIKSYSDGHPTRLVLGGDWNKVVRSDPNDLSTRTNGRIVPRAPEQSIDGFYKPKDLGQDGVADTVGFASDGHRATRIVVNVPSTY